VQQPGCKLEAIRHPNLCVDSAQMTVDGARGQLQHVCDFLTRQSVSHMSGNLELTCSETACHGAAAMRVFEGKRYHLIGRQALTFAP
jgi:hypothetical protein